MKSKKGLLHAVIVYLVLIAMAIIPEAGNTTKKQMKKLLHINRVSFYSRVAVHEIWAMDIKPCKQSFANEDLHRVKLCGRNLRNASFEEANLNGANFKGADCSGASFCKANLENAHFEGAILDGAYFGYSNLKKAKLNGAYLGTHRRVKTWTRAEHSYDEKVNFEKANLQDADLRDVNIFGATFKGADMKGAKVNDPDWKEKFKGAKLKGVKWFS